VRRLLRMIVRRTASRRLKKPILKMTELLTAVEQWVRQESLNSDAAEELAELRKVALRMFGR
jgi:hypothetical protein